MTLKAENLGLWRGERYLCRGLSFTLEAGNLLQLTGPNGSGKTSLMRAVAGIGRLDEGRITWDAQPMRHASTYAGQVTYLGHQNGLKYHLNAIENYQFYQSIAVYPSETGAEKGLASFALEEVMRRPVALLSMGQKRRAALTRLVAVQARLWLLDEPLSSLDAAGVGLITGLLRRHLEQGGLAVVSTHQPLDLDRLPVQQLKLGAAV